MRTKTTSPERTAYLAGWGASRRSRTADLDAAEAWFEARHGAGFGGTMFAAGWTDHAADNDKWTSFAEAAQEQPETAPLRAEEPEAAEPPAEAVKQAESAGDLRTQVARAEASTTLDWKGNYNTVYIPLVEAVVAGSPTVDVAVENVSARLRRTHLYGPKADVGATATLLGELEAAATAALRTWQKVTAQLVGARKLPTVTFASDMEKAMIGAEAAHRAGRAAGKSAGFVERVARP